MFQDSSDAPPAGEVRKRQHHPARKSIISRGYFSRLGPGIVTGAAADAFALSLRDIGITDDARTFGTALVPNLGVTTEATTFAGQLATGINISADALGAAGQIAGGITFSSDDVSTAIAGLNAGSGFTRGALDIADLLPTATGFSLEATRIFGVLPTSIGLKADVLTSLATALQLNIDPVAGQLNAVATKLAQAHLTQAGSTAYTNELIAARRTGDDSVLDAKYGNFDYLETAKRNQLEAKARGLYIESIALKLAQASSTLVGSATYLTNLANARASGDDRVLDETYGNFNYLGQADLNLVETRARELLRGMRGYSVGTNYVPNDGPAYLHKGEAVVPRAYNPAAGAPQQQQDNSELVAEIRALRNAVAALQKAADSSAASNAKTANTLVRVTRDGNSLITKAV